MFVCLSVLCVCLVNGHRAIGALAVFLPQDTSGQQEQGAKVEIYPNPVKDYLMVKVLGAEPGNRVGIEVLSMIGNRIAVQPEEVRDNLFRLSFIGFTSGYYFILINDDLGKIKEAYKIRKL